MSQYKNRLKEIAEIPEKKKSFSSVPPKYNDLINEHQEYMASNAVITMHITILNLNTQEDYENIVTALKNIEGIEDIGTFKRKKLSVSFNQHQTRLEEIVYEISKLGYRYINRF